jgi:NADH:quinone reductase (non-electrogenic)
VQTRVVIVGGGFAGVACARALAKHDDIYVTLVDRNDYHQFQPLLYQVATSMLAPRDIAYPLRKIAAEYHDFDAKRGNVVSIDPAARSVTTETGETYSGDYLVLAAGSQPNFFKTPGAEHAFPLYSLDDAERLSTRIIQAFEEADRDTRLANDGAIDFVVVGGGPTGVEVAGALSEMIDTTMAHEFPALASQAKVRLVDHGHALLGMFADKAHAYSAKVLEKDGVELLMGTAVSEIGPGHVTLSDGTTIRTRCVIWGGGLMAAPVAGVSGLPQGRGGRVDVNEDFTVPGFPGVLVIGDKGTMAMIGRGAAVAQVKGVELHGKLAFTAWLGVHAALMTGGSNRVSAFKSWAIDYFGKERAPEALDRSGTPRMTWEEDDAVATAGTAGGTR